MRMIENVKPKVNVCGNEFRESSSVKLLSVIVMEKIIFMVIRRKGA